MTADLRFQVIRRSVEELAALEGELAGRLDRAQQLFTGHPDTLAAVKHLRQMVQAHHDQLTAYLKDSEGAEQSGETANPHTTPWEATALSGVLRDLSLGFHRCALGYAMLYEVALRLYEPRLREIAPRHLKAHADASLSTARLLPGVVAWQLAQNGLLCACICPMCSIGACGCVYYGTQTLTAAWRDAVPSEPEQPGFVLQTPKPESQLARAGVLGGDMVIAVDDEQVRDFPQSQVAIRKHALGDEVRLLIQRGSETPRGVVVQHVSDYPKS